MVSMNTKNIVKKTVGVILVIVGAAAGIWSSFILFDILLPFWVYSSVNNVMGVYGINEFIGKLISLFFAVLVGWYTTTILFKIIKRDKKWMPMLAGGLALWFVVMYFVSSSYTSGPFNPFSGKAQAVYLRMQDGTIKSFPKGLKFDPDTGRELKEFDPATAEEYQKQQKTGKQKPISKKDDGFLSGLASFLFGPKVSRPIYVKDKIRFLMDTTGMRIEKIKIAPDRTIVVFSAGPNEEIYGFNQPEEVYLTDNQGRVYDLVRDEASYELAKDYQFLLDGGTDGVHFVRAGEIYRFEKIFQPLKPDFSGLKIHCTIWQEENVTLDDLLLDAEIVPALPPELSEEESVVEEDIVRKVKVDRNQTPRMVLQISGRQLLEFEECASETMPRIDSQEVEVVFFRVKRFNFSEEDLIREYDSRGLRPDPYAQAEVNRQDPYFSDDHPNIVQWKRTDGNYSILEFSKLVASKAGVPDNELRFFNKTTSCNGGEKINWSNAWWFGGVRK